MSHKKEDLHEIEDSDEDGLKLDILDLRKNRIPRILQVLMYLIGLVGTILILISLGCMLFNPGNKEEYLSNHKLSSSLDNWDRNNLGEQFKTFKLSLTVKSFVQERKSEYIDFSSNKDPHFNLTQKPGYFLKNFTDNKFEFGVFEFEQFNVPLGNPADYCFSVKFFDKIKKLIYHKDSQEHLLNEPACRLEASNRFDSIDTTGVKIRPWVQVKSSCEMCACEKGFIQHIDGKKFCFQYQILEAVCLVVSENDVSQMVFEGGCFKGGEHQVYRQAELHERTSFQQLILEIRNIDDPYIVALSLSNSNVPYVFKNANFPVIIRWIFQLGLLGIIIVVMINLVYKANYSPNAYFERRRRINSIIYLKQQI